jgi:hypothetical protein
LTNKGGAVRQRSSIWVWLVVLGAVSVAAQGGGAAGSDQFLGTWSGTWDGAGTGGFEITLNKGANGALSGKVSVTGEPTYDATLRTVSFEGSKLSARYDFPPDPAGEVVLAATFDGAKATGTWSLREKASGSEIATGGWNVTKK